MSTQQAQPIQRAAPTPFVPAPTGIPAGLRRARWLLGGTFFLLICTVAVGLSWDRRWHTTHAFDSFYSPPHLFSYGMTVVVALLVTFLVFSPGYRRWFGPGFRVPVLLFSRFVDPATASPTTPAKAPPPNPPTWSTASCAATSSPSRR